jgi:DNA-directed RNA polymerase specialized sigma24 family protein
MDTPVEFAKPEANLHKRGQRFLGFKLQPGDQALLERLSEGQRELLLADGTYKERADRFNLPIGTVRSRIHRARVLLEHLRAENAPESTPPIN